MDARSIIRTLLLIIALINQILVSAGKSPLPIEDETVELVVSSSFTIVMSVWSWWKNNYISNTGLEQKKTLQKYGLYKK